MEANFIGDVRKRPIVSDKIVDKDAAVAICSFNSADKCKELEITNNIAAGNEVEYGFISYTHNCGQSASQKVFKSNTAYSNRAVGIRLFPDPSEPS